jgi:hypothetical protein
MYRLGSLAVIVLGGLVLAGDLLFAYRMMSDILAWGPH